MQKIILSTLFLFICIITDYIFGQDTYQLSNQFTKYLQNMFDYGNENGLVESLLLIFYTFSQKQIIGIIFIILWLKSGVKEQILKLITMHSIASFFGHLFKMILTEPRPFYMESEVRLDFCQRGYGSPSENALSSMVFYVILSETILFKKYKAQNQELGGFSQINQEQKNQYPYKVISNDDLYISLYPNSIFSYNQHKLMLSIYIFITGLSNVYFGVNYLNQVIIGWIIGGYIIYLYYFCSIERLVEKFFVSAIFNRQQDVKTKIIKSAKSSIIFIVPLLIAIFLFIYRMKFSEETLQSQQQWREYFDNQSKCKEKIAYYEMSFEKLDIIGSCVIFLPYYLFLSCYFTNGHYKPELYNNTVLSLKGVIRAIILIFLISGQVLINIFIRRNIIGVDFQLKMRYLITFQLILQLYFSVALITLVPLLYKFLHIDVEGDFLRIVNQTEIEEVEL